MVNAEFAFRKQNRNWHRKQSRQRELKIHTRPIGDKQPRFAPPMINQTIDDRNHTLKRNQKQIFGTIIITIFSFSHFDIDSAHLCNTTALASQIGYFCIFLVASLSAFAFPSRRPYYYFISSTRIIICFFALFFLWIIKKRNRNEWIKKRIQFIEFTLTPLCSQCSPLFHAFWSNIWFYTDTVRGQ